MGFICFLGASLFLAAMLQPYCAGKDRQVLKSEQLALTVLLGLAILVSTNWVLACFKLLTGPSLWISMGVYSLVGGVLCLVRRPAISQRDSQGLTFLEFLAFALLGLSVLYVAVRGSVIWVGEYDALTYHFPKAVEIIRAHTIPYIPSGDFRVAYFPWNYELLLADGLLLTPGDGLSYLMSLLPAFGFAAYAHAIFRRAWPHASRFDALVGTLLVCATPIFVLQAGDYKNDLLFAFFLLSFFYWMSLWCQSSRRREFALALLSLGLCFGTKATALFVLPVCFVILWRFRSRFSLKALGGLRGTALMAVGVVIAFFLVGGGWPLLNKLWCGHFLGDFARVGGMSGYEANAVPRYTGFANLWKFPLLAILRPFSSNLEGVWVFWKHQYWWWPAYHPIYGHFGWLCSVMLLLAPLGVFLHLKSKDDVRSGFRVAISVSMLAFVLLSLPQKYRVDGMFCGFPRSLLCLPVLVALWTLVPLLGWLRDHGKIVFCTLIGLGVMAYFSAQSAIYLKNDVTKPFDMVQGILSGSVVRPTDDMANALDQAAGPTDTIAFDSGFGGMVYPLYGAQLTRPVIFLRPSAGPVSIPPQAKWVVIDRAWNVGWSHPGVSDTGQFWLPIKRAPTAEDMALFTQLSKDPDFALVWVNPLGDQAIFQRRGGHS